MLCLQDRLMELLAAVESTPVSIEVATETHHRHDLYIWKTSITLEVVLLIYHKINDQIQKDYPDDKNATTTEYMEDQSLNILQKLVEKRVTPNPHRARALGWLILNADWEGYGVQLEQFIYAHGGFAKAIAFAEQKIDSDYIRSSYYFDDEFP